MDRRCRGSRLAAVSLPRRALPWAVAYAVIAVGTCGLVGCGGDGGSPQQAAQGDADPGLSDLKMFLEAAKAAGRKTTRDVALPVIQAQHMAADYYLGTGDIVFEWGAELSTGPEAAKRIVAYQKAAKSDGGWALFQDGSLRRITAAEFAAAPKAER